MNEPENHTPGPWRIDNCAMEHRKDLLSQNDGYHYIEAGRGFYGEGFDLSGYLSLADLRLIAAAPELLDALKDMAAGWRYIRRVHGDLSGVGWDRAQYGAEAAIAKVEGRSLDEVDPATRETVLGL